MKRPTDFDLSKARQYCDNPDCSCFEVVGGGNIRTHSRSKGQVYCAVCKNRWVITKGTIRFGLKTPIKKVIQTLLLMVDGMGLRKASRQQGITPDTASQWIEKAAEHQEGFTNYMIQEMNLEKIRIKEFWNFIHKKKKSNSDTINIK